MEEIISEVSIKVKESDINSTKDQENLFLLHCDERLVLCFRLIDDLLSSFKKKMDFQLSCFQCDGDKPVEEVDR